MALIMSQQVMSQRPFITVWNTVSPAGYCCSTSITILTTGSGYNYDVDWNNDGVYDQFGLTGNVTHDYGTAGTYTVAIRGAFPRIYFNGYPDATPFKILDIIQWGDQVWSSMESAFLGCRNLNITATDIPNLTNVTSMLGMFYGCRNLNGPANIGSWNVSTVNDMASMFNTAYAFNQNISSWNVSKVTQMNFMFFDTKSFNQNINSWDVSAVLNMRSMFQYATAFNQNIGSWNVSKVTLMLNMFNSASAFNQILGAWGTKFNANVDLSNFLDNCGMSITNYDATLTGFRAGTITGRSLGAGGRTYCAAVADRANLVLPTASGGKGWTISGDANGCTTTSLSSNLNPSLAGQNVTFTAAVSPNTTTGTVTFKDGSTTLGTGTLGGGVTTFTTTGLSVATHSITAVYGGSISKSASTSIALSQVVNPIISIANGLWNDNTTWNVNRIPVIGDIMVIDTPHTITLSGTGNAKNLTIRGKLILNTVSSILRLGF